MKTKAIVTIVGFGIMGKAIARATRKKNPSIVIFTVDKNKKDTSGIKKSDFIILAVKPQDAPNAIKQLQNYGISKKTILISIMAGVSIKKLLSLSGHKKIIRMMPNLGLSVGAGIAVWKGVGLSKQEAKKAKNFIGSITENFEVQSEEAINKATAISGSGPAYFFLLAEAIRKTAAKLGFKEKEAKILTEKTLIASAKLGESADYLNLINKVASRGGTTETALQYFKRKNFDKIVENAIRSALKRAKELSS